MACFPFGENLKTDGRAVRSASSHAFDALESRRLLAFAAPEQPATREARGARREGNPTFAVQLAFNSQRRGIETGKVAGDFSTPPPRSQSASAIE